MASTSTSSFQKSFKYDVFLSFRGEDTRNTFVSHLYKALEQNSIQTYKDDEKIEKGETIDTQLMESIEDSRFYIIVFSKDYAGSSWCLEELVKIMECRKASEQTAYPVFYDVEPTEIRKQSGAVEKAFEKHENKEAAGKWRNALKEAADLAGWEPKKTANGDESKLIQIIVDDIFKKIYSSISSVDEDLVGMETRIETVLSSLELDADDFRMIGIWGMGGGGKTTLARAVFDRISIQFDGKAFVENVREVSKSSLDGLNKLQQQVLSSVLGREKITVSNVHEGKNMMKRMICGRKVLVVLDDVDDIEQLKALAGAPDWFKSGSRVIITTRDKQVLSSHGVKFINDVNLLLPAEAICLLSKHAFKRDIPNEGYEELSKEIVQYADGLPLTIKVLGSLLCGQNVPEWELNLERLKKIPLEATMEKLELSYKSLEKEHKKIFLDVACLLKGWCKDEAVTALKSCGFFAEVGLRVLEQRSLINISQRGKLGMHDHIEEMGKNIVRVNPNNPEKHSRLWIKEEIVDILANDSGTKAIECITLDGDGLNCKILVKGLTNMKKLRFLHVDAYGLNCDEVSSSRFDEVDPYLPNALQFLSCRGYPFSSLPKTFQAKNLVGLDMYGGNMVQLWKVGEEKACLKLRFLKLYSPDLRTLDLSVAPNLETLILENCYDLVEVHFHVTPNLKELRIFRCEKVEKLHMPAESPELRSLNLNESSKLRTLHLGKTPKLETLHLYECTDMVELCMPAESPKLRSLNLKSSKLTTLHLGKTPNLQTLILGDCNRMVELYMPAECPKLVTLDLYNLELRTLHLGITPNLEKVMLKGLPMVELHMPAECPKLVNLDLCALRLTTLRLQNTPNLETLKLQRCTKMVELAEFPKLVNLNLFYLNFKTPHIRHILAKCPKLVNLDLSFLKMTTLRLGINPNLERLSVNVCTDMVELHIATDCPKLVTVFLDYNVKLRTLDLGLTPNLQRLYLKDCYDLEEINASAECLKKLIHLSISHCGRFKSFKFDKEPDSLEVFCLPELHVIAEADDTDYANDTDDAGDADDADHTDDTDDADDLDDADDTGMCDPGNTWSEFKFTCYYKEDPASSFGNLERLISQGFGGRLKVDSFADIICGLRFLRKLTLEGGIPEAPKNFDLLDCLEELSLRSTDIKNLPDSLCMLKHLKSLEIISCNLLEKLPEDIHRLQCLEKLIVKDCLFLRDIPNCICEMHHLDYLDLTDCIRIEELPEEIGCLECLKELDITGTGINRLPQSIFQLKGLNIRGSTQILEYVMCHNTQIQNNIEDGDGDDDTDEDFYEVVDGDGDGDDDERDYEHARMSIMTMLSSGT